MGTVLFYRSAFAAPLVVLSTWWLLRRERRRSPASERPSSWGAYVPGALLGLIFAVGMVCDFQAIALAEHPIFSFEPSR